MLAKYSFRLTAYLFLIYIFSLCIQSSLFLNWDVASLLDATETLLNGGNYVKEIFAPNLPMIMYLYSPVVIISKLLHIDIITLFRLYIYSICTLSIYISYKLLKQYYQNQTNNLATLFITTFALAILVLPLYEFGNRDHLLALLSMPYLLCVANRIQGNKPNTNMALIIGVMASISFGLKPHFLLTPILIELYFMHKSRNFFSWMRVESLTILFIISIYALALYLFHYEYIQTIIPFLLRNYYLAIRVPIEKITLYPFTVFSLMSICLYAIQPRQLKQESIYAVLCLALISFVILIYSQQTLFYYHFLPALTAATMISTSLIYRFACLQTRSPAYTLRMAALAIIFLAVNTIIFNSYWTYFIFYPWLTYTFVAVLFSCLLYSSFKLSSLSIVIRIGFIVTTGILVSAIILETSLFTHRFLFTFIALSLLYLLFAWKQDKHILHHATLLILAYSLFYVPALKQYYVYLGHRQYSTGSLKKLTNFVNANADSGPIYTLSAAIYFTYPLVYYSNSTSAQRFDQLWPMLGFWKYDQAHPNKANPQLAKDKQFIIDMIAEDFQRNKPVLVFIDNKHPEFDYIQYLSKNKNFRNEWKHYKYLTTLDIGKLNNIQYQLPVYKRVSQKRNLHDRG